MTDPEVAHLLGGAPRLAYDAIVRHRRLPGAVKVYLDRFLDVYDGDPFMVRLLIEMGRIAVVHAAIMMEVAYDPARRETWPTIGRLKKHVVGFGLASARHVDELVARLREVGFLALEPSAHDGRVKILRMTEALAAHHRDWLAAHFAPLALLYPRHDYTPALAGDREFHALFRRTQLPFMALGARLIKSVPEMTRFLDRAGGYMVLAALLQAAMASDDYPHGAVRYADAGDRFGISRTHVRRLLMEAEQAGLVRLHARGGRRVEILPALWKSHERGVSGGMYLHDMVYVATLRAQAAGRQSASATASKAG